jgi:hypothetical protein
MVWMNDAAGAMLREVHGPSFPVDVCVVLSLFVQVTVPPVEIVTGFGANALVVLNSAPLVTDTGVPP